MHDALRDGVLDALAGGDELSAYRMKKVLGLERKDECQAIYYVLRRMVAAGEVACREVEAQHFHSYRGGVSKVYRLPNAEMQGESVVAFLKGEA
jgi:hypothetical protein